MTREIRVSVAAGCAVLLLTTLSCGRGKPTTVSARAHDLILITIDTLRADRVGVDGGPPGVTPNLDALGRAGAVFLDATAHAPLTLPSHASILTGRYPLSHGVHDNTGFALPGSIPTMATVLHGAGYHTGAFVSSFVLRGSTGLSRGFDVYDDRFPGAGRAHLTESSLERRGPEIAREAARWLALAPRPVFLWVHFYDPHAPYDPPQAFAERFPGRPYDAEVAASDFGVSTLVAALSAEQRADTVIVATGDHGESLGEHGESEHGILLYDATLHVPLIMQGPGIPAGVTVKRQVRHVDLLPTLLELLHVQAPSPIDGVSLAPLIVGSDTVVRTAGDAPLSYAESRFGELHFGWNPIRSARDGTWKYLDAPAPELYQLSSDPGERDNRYGARAEAGKGLARALGDLVARGDSASRPMTAPDAETAERLRSLGYVSGRVALGAGRAGGARGDPKNEIARYEAYVVTFNAGLSQLEGARPHDAEVTFRRLARAFPLAFEPHQYLGRALAARGAFTAAVAELDVAIGLSPREAVLYFDAARTLADAAQFDRAFARVAEGRRLEPSSFYGWLTEGLLARAAGQSAQAERAFREAIRLNPTLAVAHLEIGRLAETRGDHETARMEFRAALESDPELAEARRALDRLGPAVTGRK